MLSSRFHLRSATLLAVAFFLAGCGPKTSVSKDRVPPNPNAPALYGPPTGKASGEIPRALPHSRDTNWRSAPFYVLHTELSPAILIHSATRYLGLFGDLPAHGLGAPSHLAWSTKDGPRPFKPGETFDASGMDENWLLVWFAGSTNWTNWDSPWAVFLQHKPSWLRLDERGLHIEFATNAGDVVLMPLYGYFKLPPAGRDYLAEHGLKSRRLTSWEWEKALARDPLVRLRYWAGASREFPIYCEESFSVDRARDELTVRSRFELLSIDDDWKTKHVKLAPVSPALGLAAKDKAFPARFSKPFFDMELPTPFGPLLGIPDADTFDVTFPWLHYVNETEAFQAPDALGQPAIAQALARLHEVIQTNPPLGREMHFDKSGRLEAEFINLRGVEFFANALPYLARLPREKLSGQLREFFLVNTNPPGLPSGSGRSYRMRFGGYQALWAYGHFSDDWKTVRELWPRYRQDVDFLPGHSWATFGEAYMTSSEPAACVALARLAYRMGDMDMYHFACLQFVHELVHVWGAQRGAKYFWSQQPWNSMEWMDEQTVVLGASAREGWEFFDGTNFARILGDVGYYGRLGGHCWDADMARFYRDWLREDVRQEVMGLQAAPHPQRISVQIPPSSFLPVRSFVLNETPKDLAAITGWSASDQPQVLLAVLRAGQIARFERLIPPGEPSAFVPGFERYVTNASPSLVTLLQPRDAEWTSTSEVLAWPEPTWPLWHAEQGPRWTFGSIKPVRDGIPRGVRRKALNWNTEVVTYALP